MDNFTPGSGLLGGLIIGLSAALLLFANGRIAGISGIVGGLLARPRGDSAWRALFVAGMVTVGLLWQWLSPAGLPIELQTGWPGTLAAGFLVGFGARLGSGCTSGHGVCGIGRLSARSIVATGVFMTAGVVTVYVTRHLLGV
mgnify:FL=1